jgi:hypothetical protein|tara:strand:+ start:449 stop:796 length:348 start_codon:yes stop_codon:yes gene_type:complete
MNRNTIIKIEHKEYPTYMATYSEAKKYFLQYALENRNTDLTYAEDIRRFTFEELVWFVYGGNKHSNDYRVYYYSQEDHSKVGEWNFYYFNYENLFEREKNPFTYKTDFIYQDLMY